MDPLFLSRLQFTATTLFHFLFVPLTLGLSVIVAVMETQYARTGDETYLRMTKFWGKLFLINFAVGVVTGWASLQWGREGFLIALPASALAVVLFLLLTAPVAAHLIGRAAYHQGIRLFETTRIDELAASRQPDHPPSPGHPPA